MLKVELEHRLIIKAKKATDEIRDTAGEITRTIELTELQNEKIGWIDELALRIRKILNSLSA